MLGLSMAQCCVQQQKLELALKFEIECSDCEAKTFWQSGNGWFGWGLRADADWLCPECVVKVVTSGRTVFMDIDPVQYFARKGNPEVG